MRVCILTTSYPMTDAVGSGTFVRRMVEAASVSGIRQTVLVPDTPVGAPIPLTTGVVRAVRYVFPRRLQRLAHGAGIPENVRKHPLLLLEVPLLLGAMAWAAWRHSRRCDLIHVHWLPTALAAWPALWVRRLPLIASAHGSDARRLPRFLLRRISRRACVITVSSPELRSALLRAGVGDAKIRYVPYPLSVDRFDPDSVSPDRLRLEWRVEDRPLVAFIARLSRFKDPLTFVRAIPAIVRGMQGHVRCSIVGEGPLEQAVKAEVRKLGVDEYTILPGMRSDIPEILSATSVFVGTSPIQNIWSNSLVEALAMRVPCVLSDAGDTRSVFDHGDSALVVPPESPKELADAVLRLLSDEQLSRRVAAGGRGVFDTEGFREDHVAEVMMTAYRDALKRGDDHRWQ